jgi:hypothetical protein
MNGREMEVLTIPKHAESLVRSGTAMFDGAGRCGSRPLGAVWLCLRPKKWPSVSGQDVEISVYFGRFPDVNRGNRIDERLVPRE